MILDSSAVLAILRSEPEAPEFARLIEESADVSISAATLVEASLVVGPDSQALLDEFLLSARATVIPFDGAQAAVAREAAIRFGRRSSSPAKLNFGDCFSYALAKVSGRPLLCKGNDFVHTDVTLASRR